MCGVLVTKRKLGLKITKRDPVDRAFVPIKNYVKKAWGRDFPQAARSILSLVDNLSKQMKDGRDKPTGPMRISGIDFGDKKLATMVARAINRIYPKKRGKKPVFKASLTGTKLAVNIAPPTQVIRMDG